MSDLAALIESLGRPADIATAIGVRVGHVRLMKHRRSIPLRFWPRLVRFAAQQGREDVTYEALVMLHVPTTERATTCPPQP